MALARPCTAASHTTLVRTRHTRSDARLARPCARFMLGRSSFAASGGGLATLSTPRLATGITYAPSPHPGEHSLTFTVRRARALRASHANRRSLPAGTDALVREAGAQTRRPRCGSHRSPAAGDQQKWLLLHLLLLLLLLQPLRPHAL